MATWVAIGAVVGLLLGLVYAWVHSGPEHYEWTDAALVLGVAGVCFGGFAGLVVGVFRSDADED